MRLTLSGNNTAYGQRINLRLRPPGAESTFYEYDQLVLVMLHELTHNVHGPHDAKFYALLAELEEEYYALKRKGYEGEGFHGRGSHLQGLRVSEYEGRKKGLLAAQKRLDTQVRVGKGGVLGGAAAGRGKTMREVVAEAAERRIRDDKACHPAAGADGQDSEVQREVDKAQRESVGINAVDLTRSDSDEDFVEILPPIDGTKGSTREEVVDIKPVLALTTPRMAPTPSTPLPSLNLAASTRNPRLVKESRPTSASPNKPIQSGPPAPEQWSCSTCTLLNPSPSKECEACGTARPIDRDAARRDGKWMCEFCGTGSISMDRWSCTECGWVRNWG